MTEQSGDVPDMPAICAALGFDPTNHHNAAKCPYCSPATPPTPEQAGPSGEALAKERSQSFLDWWHDTGRHFMVAITDSDIAELAFKAGRASPGAMEGATFQARVQPWMLACFGQEIASDRQERNHRFLEESLELVQACGCTKDEAHQLVEYVYGRPVGVPTQEVGGVMVTLAALCLAQGIDMHAAGETELARIWTKVDTIRAKQAAKPKHSPLPAGAMEGAQAARPTCGACAGSGTVEEYDTTRGPEGGMYETDCPECGGTGAAPFYRPFKSADALKEQLSRLYDKHQGDGLALNALQCAYRAVERSGCQRLFLGGETNSGTFCGDVLLCTECGGPFRCSDPNPPTTPGGTET